MAYVSGFFFSFYGKYERIHGRVILKGNWCYTDSCSGCQACETRVFRPVCLQPWMRRMPHAQHGPPLGLTDKALERAPAARGASQQASSGAVQNSPHKVTPRGCREPSRDGLVKGWPSGVARPHIFARVTLASPTDWSGVGPAGSRGSTSSGG